MRLLLDTHVLLWWLDDPALLQGEARAAIAHPRNVVFVSAASILEIAIKEGTGKMKMESPVEEKLPACRFHELPLSIVHASALRTLPAIHKDPFDRMLLAQAQVEGLTLVTRDPVLRDYGVPMLAA